jgi:pimeloyl-ACP methyl ester carboxylesterase
MRAVVSAGAAAARTLADSDRYLELPSPEDRLARALERRLGAGSPLTSRQRASVVFDVGYTAWTVTIDGPHMELLAGRAPHPHATVHADAVTLAAVVEGTKSGVDAFLGGGLTIRGNLALVLKLEGVDYPERPTHFPRARMARADDLDTFYLEAGEGPPVVLLHGLGATNASMLPTLSALASDHRVLAVDLPGFGDSDKPVRAYDPAFYARWLVRFLDAVGIARADLIGNSMGGRIAIEAALTAPERVDRIALFAPSLAFKRFRGFAPIVRLLFAELSAIPMVAPRALVLGALRGMFSRPARLHDAWYAAAADEFARVFATPRGRIAFFSAARQIYLEEAHGEAGFWERLPALSRPALFLWGDRDRLVPCRFAHHVTKALPQARSVVLEDCGHVPQFEHPARTHALVREFFGRPR